MTLDHAPTRTGDTFDLSTIRWVTDARALDQLHGALGEADEVVLDLETTGLNPRETRETGTRYPARVVLLQMTLPVEGGGEPLTWLLPLSHPDSPWIGQWRSTLDRVIAAIDRPVTGHNVKFDLRWIEAHTGRDLSPLLLDDTMVLWRLLHEDVRYTSAELKEIVPRIFGVPAWNEGFTLKSPGAAERVPLMDLGEYGARDTYWTWRLAQYLRARMFIDADPDDPDERPDTHEEREEARLGALARTVTTPTLRVTLGMEQRGIRLDLDWCARELDRQGEVMERVYGDLVDRYPLPGAPSFEPVSLWFRSWTEAAVEAGDLRVTAYTDTSTKVNRRDPSKPLVPSWSSSVLERQAGSSPVASGLLELREATKRCQFLRSWLSKESRGRIHPEFKVARTVTGRLSSAEPNLQQVAAALKPAFIPSPGYMIVEADLSQIELRLAAFVSRAGAMLASYRNGEDLHRLTASAVTGKPLAEVTKADRQDAKAVNFGFLYLMQADQFRTYAEDTYGVKLTVAQAQDWQQRFFGLYPELHAWHARAIAEGREFGRVVSPLGRVRHFEGYYGNDEERQAVNSPIQGMGSDVMMLACGIIARTLPEVHLVGTVHDSLVAEVPEGSADESTAAILSAMTVGVLEPMARLGCHFDLPLGAEAVIGSRWGVADRMLVDRGVLDRRPI